MKRKTLADYLYDVMIENGYEILTIGNIEILEKVLVRYNSKQHKINKNYDDDYNDMIKLIKKVMNTKRGKELFDYADYFYCDKNGNTCEVIKIKSSD